MFRNLIPSTEHNLKSTQNQILSKIKSDLNHGVKILGTHTNQSDIIRVWTRYKNDTFAVVANSATRFGTAIQSLEIQSFGSTSFRLAIVLYESNKDDELKFQKITSTNSYQEFSIDSDEFKRFVESYIESKPDKKLTKECFERYAYAEGQYEWLNH